ncbi:cilia- and flagella-associated protein 61, partial [Tachysurus ichikawai]
MTSITSSSGENASIIVRRTESCDAHKISALISPETSAVFGKVNVISLLEKANMTVTICTINNKVLAHAAFLDHPIGDLVDQASWEKFLQTHFNASKITPLNTIFLHLFVAQPDFSVSCAKEIIRTVFNAITELEYICLVTPYSSSLEPALMDTFEPMPCVTDEIQCGAFVCHRHNYWPRLHVRRARC